MSAAVTLAVLSLPLYFMAAASRKPCEGGRNVIALYGPSLAFACCFTAALALTIGEVA